MMMIIYSQALFNYTILLFSYHYVYQSNFDWASELINNLCLKLRKQIIMSDNEQGFAIEEPTQLIQYNYQPSSRAWTVLSKKVYPLFKKSNPFSLVTCSTKLINNSIHSEWLESLISLGKAKNIVFNAGGKTLCNFQENNVCFDSQFQSGNMQIISRIKSNEYWLYMKPDTNTKHHFQWFYFKVNIRKGNKTIKFTIKNFIKSTMLYSKGLKPYCRSLKNPDFHQFQQIDSFVKFYEDEQTDYFNLEFHHHFQFDNDEVQFCSQPPYSFQQLNKLIEPLKCKKLTLGKTIMGNKIPYLFFQAKKQTKVLGIAIARQHPGEPVGSWMMEGFINYLNQHKGNQFITWIIIPMVNIDGVILGNNRTGVLGHDFNRNWFADQGAPNSRSAKLFPEIAAIIALVKNLRRKYPRKLKMFLDLHGHSSQKNVFTYGPPHQEQSQYFYQCRLFPQLIAKTNNNFKLNQCSYVLHPEKKNTARSIIFYNLGIPFTYTIQSTFGIMNDRNVTTDDFIKIGEDIAISAHQFLYAAVIKENLSSLSILIDDIKQKYANAKNEGEQFDSASEASDENPSRQKIQQMVIADQLAESKLPETIPKVNKRYDESKSQSCENERFKSLGRPSITVQKQSRTCSNAKKLEKRRVNTQIELVLNRKQCMFPNIATKNSKLGFAQMSFMSNEQMMQNLKIDDIQKRLHKLRNSKIGKKILVINAYCS